jgi:putative CRISPR-associated protein (TIGR02619 family)
MTLLISTCGTSILTNLAAGDERSWLTSIANEPDGDDRAYSFIARIEATLARTDADQFPRLSAEFAGVRSLRTQLPGRLDHLLVHTDTFIGREAARLVGSLLSAQGENVQLLTAPGLRTSRLADFRLALPDLTRTLDESYLTPFERARLPVAFNLTGGFKSLLAYLQTFATLHGLPSFLLFEGAAEAMQIPALPVRLDEEGLLRDHLDRFRRLSLGYPLRATDHPQLPPTLFADLDGELLLTEWGELVWSRLRKQALSDGPLPPLSPRLALDPALAATFAGFPPERRAQANESLDALSAHLDTGRPLLKSMTFKQFTSPQEPRMTHELYAWNDGDAGRLMIELRNGTYLVYKLRSHLR